MFIRAKNIETAFQFIRIFCIVTVITSLVTSGLIAYHSLNMITRSSDKIYILASGKVLEAFVSDRKENIPVEARDHIRTFHQYLFSLAPDEKVITGNITHALYLADASAKRFYDNLREGGYYAGIISGNITQDISVDSIHLDTNSYPFYFRCFARQKIIRTTSTVTRNLITEGWLRNTIRSDNNPHGFLIERWNTIENKDLKVENR